MNTYNTLHLFVGWVMVSLGSYAVIFSFASFDPFFIVALIAVMFGGFLIGQAE